MHLGTKILVVVKHQVQRVVQQSMLGLVAALHLLKFKQLFNYRPNETKWAVKEINAQCRSAVSVSNDYRPVVAAI